MKVKTLSFILFAALFIFPVQAEAQLMAGPHGEGDLNNDGYVSPGDTLILINYINGVGQLTQDQFYRGDVSPFTEIGNRVCPQGDGIVFSADLLVLINMINGGQDGFSPLTECEYDFDQDGYIDEGSPGGSDCDDLNPDVNPGAVEIMDNGIDDDCDGLIDAEDPCCSDNDGDGYGYPASPECTYPEEDCDDDPLDDPSVCTTCLCGVVECAICARCINPAATEFQGDGIDSNCNGQDPGYSAVANASAAAYGAGSLRGSGIFNEVIFLLVPVGAVIFLRISRRKR